MIVSAGVIFQCMSGKICQIPLHRHEDFERIIQALSLQVFRSTISYGFYTDKKIFLNPLEAKKHARESGQKFIPGKEDPTNPYLKDTDLW